jgi:hypothetical protein
MNSAGAETPPRTKRWIPVSVKVLVFLLLTLSAASVYFALPLVHNYRAIKRVDALGGAYSGGPTRSQVPWWLASVVGEDVKRSMGDIRGVFIFSGSISDTDMELIARARNLQSLKIQNAELKHGAFRPLAGNNSIQVIDLSNSTGCNDAIAHIATLKSLRDLCLERSDVDNVGFRQLVGLNELTTLSLDGTAIDDSSASHFAEFPSVKNIGLSGTNLTDAGIDALNIQQFDFINVQNTHVTDGRIDRLFTDWPGKNIAWTPHRDWSDLGSAPPEDEVSE